MQVSKVLKIHLRKQSETFGHNPNQMLHHRRQQEETKSISTLQTRLIPQRILSKIIQSNSNTNLILDFEGFVIIWFGKIWFVIFK